jgi:hypothetical protein
MGLFNVHVSEFIGAVEAGRWAGWSASAGSGR